MKTAMSYGIHVLEGEGDPFSKKKETREHLFATAHQVI
jgi:hypothetical protein